jgi:hypothetical protein
MRRKTFTPEQIIGKLREAEVLLNSPLKNVSPTRFSAQF